MANGASADDVFTNVLAEDADAIAPPRHCGAKKIITAIVKSDKVL